MSKFLMLVVTASFLSSIAQSGLTQEAHERPDPEPGMSDVVRIEVRADRLLGGYDLASSGLAADDLISVTGFPSSGKIDASSRNDY